MEDVIVGHIVPYVAEASTLHSKMLVLNKTLYKRIIEESDKYVRYVLYDNVRVPPSDQKKIKSLSIMGSDIDLTRYSGLSYLKITSLIFARIPHAVQITKMNSLSKVSMLNTELLHFVTYRGLYISCYFRGISMTYGIFESFGDFIRFNTSCKILVLSNMTNVKTIKKNGYIHSTIKEIAAGDMRHHTDSKLLIRYMAEVYPAATTVQIVTGLFPAT